MYIKVYSVDMFFPLGNNSVGTLGEATLDFDLVMGLLNATQEVKQYAVGSVESIMNPGE